MYSYRHTAAQHMAALLCMLHTAGTARAVATADAGGAVSTPPLECQPLVGESRFIPQFHAVPELRRRPTDGLWWPGQANDANAVFEHQGVLHVMFQTYCTELDSNATDGICAGGKVGAHAFSHLVSTDGGAHWERLVDALIPTPGSAYDGFDGDCDGTVSFPDGIGPVILWGADCGTGKWPPKPPGSGFGPPPSQPRRQLSADYPRVAVAMATNASDPLLRSWTKSKVNPVVWADPTQPCSFPGRVWKSDTKLTGKPPHWSMVGTGAREGPKPTTMANWNRYETADPTLHGPWVLADTSFATKANGQPIGSISTPGFYSLPNPRPGEPTHIINGGMGGSFYTAHFDPAKERLFNLSARGYHVGGSWGVAGQSESDGSILHIGWSSGPGGRAGPGIAMMSAVTELSYDSAADVLVATPARFYSKMHNGTLANQSTLTLGSSSSASRAYTPPLVEGTAGAASDLTLRLAIPADSGVAVAFEVRVLASVLPNGNATAVMINVTAAGANGKGRTGHISVTPSFALKTAHGQSFAVLETEESIDVRVLTDRSIVEAFAMGGRGVDAAHDYPEEGNGRFHLINHGSAALVVQNLSIASMACGWK